MGGRHRDIRLNAALTKNTYEKMENENKELVFPDKDEDTITIHLGKVLTEKQYDAVLHSVVDHLNLHWRHILGWTS